jgi:membrane protein YqaA with SNARE-associated domain
LIDKAPKHPWPVKFILMDAAWISAFSAVMGSLVGGFTTFVTTYANQRSQYRRDFLSKQFAKRETLYSEFINEAARLQIDSFDRQIVKWTTQVDW